MLFLFLGDPKTTRLNIISFQKKYAEQNIIVRNEIESISEFLKKSAGASLFGGASLLLIETKKNDAELKEEITLKELSQFGKDSDIAITITENLPKTHPLRKLISEEGKLIEAAEVPKSVFPFLDALSSKNPGRVFSELEKLLNDGNEPVFVNLMVAYALRNLIRVKFGAVAGINPYVVKKTKARVDGFSEEKLKALFLKVKENDKAFKSGENEKRLLQTLVYAFIN